MKFLLRAAFWLSVVVVLLPASPSPDKAQAPQVSAAAALSAASAAMSDMRQFCVRQPDACAIGSQALTLFGEKAETGARMLHHFLSERSGGESDGTATVSDTSGRNSGVKSAHGTLLPADLAPSWRGPTLRRPVQTKHPA